LLYNLRCWIVIICILNTWFHKGKLTRQGFHQVWLLYLCPAEVTLFHFFFVVLDPPVPIFEKRSYHYWVITFTNKVLVYDIRRWQQKIIGFCSADGFIQITNCLVKLIIFFHIAWSWSIILVAQRINSFPVELLRGTYFVIDIFNVLIQVGSEISVRIIQFLPQAKY